MNELNAISVRTLLVSSSNSLSVCVCVCQLQRSNIDIAAAPAESTSASAAFGNERKMSETRVLDQSSWNRLFSSSVPDGPPSISLQAHASRRLQAPSVARAFRPLSS